MTEVIDTQQQQTKINGMDMDDNKENGVPGDSNTVHTTKEEEGGEETMKSTQDLKTSLKKKIEYIFTKEYLSTDLSLVVQLNSNKSNSVSVKYLTDLDIIQSITNDINLIIEVLKESNVVTFDESSQSVKPNIKLNQRNTIIIREAGNATEQDIRDLFNENKYTERLVDVHPDVAGTWFVQFEDEDITTDAFFYLRTGKTINGVPVQARVKSENLLSSVVASQKANSTGSNQVDPGNTLNQGYSNWNFNPYSQGNEYYGMNYNMTGNNYNSYNQNSPNGRYYNNTTPNNGWNNHSQPAMNGSTNSSWSYSNTNNRNMSFEPMRGKRGGSGYRGGRRKPYRGGNNTNKDQGNTNHHHPRTTTRGSNNNNNNNNNSNSLNRKPRKEKERNQRDTTKRHQTNSKPVELGLNNFPPLPSSQENQKKPSSLSGSKDNLGKTKSPSKSSTPNSKENNTHHRPLPLSEGWKGAVLKKPVSPPTKQRQQPQQKPAPPKPVLSQQKPNIKKPPLKSPVKQQQQQQYDTSKKSKSVVTSSKSKQQQRVSPTQGKRNVGGNKIPHVNGVDKKEVGKNGHEGKSKVVESEKKVEKIESGNKGQDSSKNDSSINVKNDVEKKKKEDSSEGGEKRVVGNSSQEKSSSALKGSSPITRSYADIARANSAKVSQ